MSIGNRISELRKKHNYSQEYVAEQLDVSRQAVSKWEQDRSSPDTKNLVALAELFSVSVEYLATGKAVDMPQNSNEKSSAHKEIHDQTGANRLLGIIILAIGIVFCVVMWLVKAPSWLIIMTAISFALAVCFILIFAGKFNYKNTDLFNSEKENDDKKV